MWRRQARRCLVVNLGQAWRELGALGFSSLLLIRSSIHSSSKRAIIRTVGVIVVNTSRHCTTILQNTPTQNKTVQRTETRNDHAPTCARNGTPGENWPPSRFHQTTSTYLLQVDKNIRCTTDYAAAHIPRMPRSLLLSWLACTWSGQGLSRSPSWASCPSAS